jgi:DNA-binding transcriptional ArsR family regulator
MDLTKTLDALSNPGRREILRVLRRKPLTVGQIAEQIDDLTYSAISKHLVVLKEAELVDFTRVGSFMVYELNSSIFEDVLAWIKSFEEEVKSESIKESSFDIIIRCRN